jgi:hypothetical protein
MLFRNYCIQKLFNPALSITVDHYFGYCDTATLAASLSLLVAGRRLSGVRVEQGDGDGGDGRCRVPGLPLHLRGLVGGRQAGRQQQGRSEEEQKIIYFILLQIPTKYFKRSYKRGTILTLGEASKMFTGTPENNSGSRIRIFSSRIRILDPGVKKALDPGSDPDPQHS